MMFMEASPQGDPHAELAALLTQVAQRKAEALEELYDRVSGALLGVVTSVLNNREEAEETLQDVFVTIWKKAEAYDPSLGKAVSWMMTIARNKAYDRVRSIGRRTELRKSTEDELHARTREAFRRHWEPGMKDDEMATITRALETLPDEQQTAIELVLLEGLTHQEAAERLQAPLGTVKARIRRGLLRIRELVGRHLSPAGSNTTGGAR